MLEQGLSSLGLRDLRRVPGGWQSVAVYEAHLDGRHLAVKVLDPGNVDRRTLDIRLEVLSRLATTTDGVCAPVPVGGRLVNEPAPSAYAVAYRFAEGDAPDAGRPGDAARMGRALAELHASLAALPPVELPSLAAFPPVAELAPVATGRGVSTAGLLDAAPAGRRQLLHGDFSSTNVRFSGERWRVFDFDDCGYGPVELDIALSLYFVLFDALTGPGPDRYRRFRTGFLAGYRHRSGAAPDDAVLHALITRRVLALASWLDDPATAPPGVRGASDGWRATLEGFVHRYLTTEIGGGRRR